MMTHAYSESYLDDAMENLGDMFSFAVDECEYDPDEFFLWFLKSGIANEFGKGNPKYISGMSGLELLDEVIAKTKGIRIKKFPLVISEDKKEAYWAGWSLAYYQWYSGKSFRELYRHGLTMKKLMSMYLLHEADLSKFIMEADMVISKSEESTGSSLQRIRKLRGLTQSQLSKLSGVSLRMIQLYEQKKNDIKQAAADTVRRLAETLDCRIIDLLE